MAAGIAAAAGAGIVTVPVTIRSRSISTSAHSNVSAAHDERYKGHHEENSDDEWRAQHHNLKVHSSNGSDLEDSDNIDRSHEHDDEMGSKTSGSSHEHHLSHVIRKHTNSTALGTGGKSSRFKKPKTKEHAVEDAREEAMKPFEMPKKMLGVERELADLTAKAKKKAKKRSAARTKVPKITDISPSITSSSGGSTFDGKGDVDTEFSPRAKPTPPLYEGFNSFKVGSLHSMDIGKMHRGAKLHIKKVPRDQISGERDLSATTGTSSVTLTDSVSSASDDIDNFDSHVRTPAKKVHGEDSDATSPSAYPAPTFRGMVSQPPTSSFNMPRRTMELIIGHWASY